VNAPVDFMALKDGVLTLYVNFDTGKTTIKPESDKTLDDAAAVLKAKGCGQRRKFRSPFPCL